MGENGNGGRAPLRIVSFQAENVKRLKAISIQFDPERNVHILSGKNRQGKSSVLDAIWWSLGGERDIPAKPIRDGEESGYCTLDLGEFIVTRRFTQNGTYLEVKTANGFKASSPQTFLSSKLGARAKNPLAFMTLQPAEQITALQNMVNLKQHFDLARLGLISGLSVEGMEVDDPIEIIDSAYKHLYSERTEKNKEVKRLESVVKSIVIPAGKEETEKVSVQELFAERKILDQKVQNNRQTRDILQKCEQRLSDASAVAGMLTKDIRELEIALQRAMDSLADQLTEIEEITKERDALSVEVNALKDPDFTDIDARIAAADETNRIAGDVEKKAQAMTDHLQAEGEAADLSAKLAAIKSYKTELIQQAGLPVPGLGFNEGEVTFNGIPLSQASTAEQIQISCALCAAEHPDIALLTIDRGWADLDSDGQAALREFADKQNVMVICTHVADEPGDEGFFIIDGSVAAIDGEMVDSQK